jgi:hypothetical protein
LQLRISLMDVTPTIWRRLLVPGEIKLSKLHTIFQAAMGWEDYHLHYFEIDGQRYGMPDDDWDNDDIDEETVVLADLITGRTRFFYEYDFGDSWRHEVVVESFEPVPLILKFAICIDGQRACPPEDCGGTHGYRDFLVAVGDPDDEEHGDYLAWAGGPFDPEAFDLVSANAHLQRVR